MAAQETPQARAARYIAELDKKSYTQGEVKTLLHAIETLQDKTPGPTVSMSPVEDIQRGDVFIAPGVGGKNRPWAVTRVYEDYVVAIALSSGDKAPNMIEIDCRFWQGSWIGSASAQFPIQMAQKGVTRPLTNLDQLAEAEAALIRALTGAAGEVIDLPTTATFKTRRAA